MSRASRYKTAYGGEWVRVRNLMNAHFSAAAPCSLCRAFTCDVVWYSIKTKQVRCTKCFTPEGYAGLAAAGPAP